MYLFFFSVRCRLVIFVVPLGWWTAPSGVGRCRLVIFVVPSGRWTAPSGVGRWLFHGVCFLGNFLLARCFLFPFCVEGMTAWHGLQFVLPVRRGNGLTFQCQSFSCGYAVCSGHVPLKSKCKSFLFSSNTNRQYMLKDIIWICIYIKPFCIIPLFICYREGSSYMYPNLVILSKVTEDLSKYPEIPLLNQLQWLCFYQ